jgi:cysteine desulfurase/selenocysteine lyase
MIDLQKFRQDFPLLRNNPQFSYLDSTATSLKPDSVIQKEVEYYQEYSANIHRGIYAISERATEAYEQSREAVARFIHAPSPDEVIFTRNATEAVNLVVSSFAEDMLQPGDEIVITITEHHANLVPWQQLANRKNLKLNIIPMREDYQLAILNEDGSSVVAEQLQTYITEKTRILAFVAVSNVLGTKNPVAEIITAARSLNPNLKVLVDAAQAVPHTVVNVQQWDADFIVFSGHKMLGPTGVGVLWGRKELLNNMRPYQYGGEMIRDVSVEYSEFKDTPHRFEAGTPHIAGVIAMQESIRYLETVGLSRVEEFESYLAVRAIQLLQEEFGTQVQIFGTKETERTGIISFTFGSYHPHDIAQILGESGVAVRAGHHCTMPLHKSRSVNATVRASFYLYNREEDIVRLVQGLKKVTSVL